MATLTEEMVIEEIQVEGYEKVMKFSDPKSGLDAIIAIHDSRLGPALGGIRIYPYADFDAALFDVLRLAKGMTYKSALAESGLGGGKSVIISDTKEGKTEEKLRAFGRAVESLEGRYICAEDVGCSTDDVRIIRQETSNVVGLAHAKSSGNPAPFTAWGVFRGIEATAKAIFGSDSLRGKRVAVQGLGAVGMCLVEYLYWHGAYVIGADIDPTSVEEARQKYGIEVVSHEDILFVDCDILAPCALGAIFDSETIPKLKCKGIAGAANNQLLDATTDSKLLADRQILYAPDFVLNSGGLINVSFELDKKGYDPLKARDKVSQIYDVLLSIYRIAKQNKATTVEAAASLAEHRLQYEIGKRVEKHHFHH